jgi:hypothetical protein
MKLLIITLACFFAIAQAASKGAAMKLIKGNEQLLGSKN